MKMGLFSRKNLTSDEYADLSAKLVKLTSDMQLLRADSEKYEERIRSLHSRVTKRIKEAEELEEEEEEVQLTPAEVQRRLMGMT